MAKKVSAIIPTFNEEHNIVNAIASVKWADEVLVVDSFSTDNTVALAKENGARVIQREYGYSASQKNWAIPQAAYEWIVLIDADERVEEPLQKEIQEVLAKDDEPYQAYWMYRKNFFLGKQIRYCGWQRDRVIRLFKRDLCQYEDKNVHAELLCEGKVGVLKNKLFHNTFLDIHHYLEKWDRYTTWSANDHFKKTPNPGLYHFAVKPIARFISSYIINLGFLDGLTGFILCNLDAGSVFMRYIKVYQLKLNKSKQR